MDIREANKKDIQDILEVIENSYAPYRDLAGGVNIPVYTYEEISVLLEDPQSDVWVAEENGKKIGMAAGTEFGPRAYHLKMLFVFGDSQHMGVGSALLRCFEKRGAERHYSFYTANYLDWAKWSWSFYEKHGYREYTPEDEKIGRLNNGGKHLIWKNR